MRYYLVLDDLNNKGANVEKIKKDLFKIMRELRMKDEAGEIHKRNPVDVLNEFAAEAFPAPKVLMRGSGSDMSSPMSPSSPMFDFSKGMP